jgi:myo-inositol-1(or 4)-monophosphatase
MMKAAERTASRLVRDFGELEKLQGTRNEFKGFVTASQENAESKIMYDLSKFKPDYSFLCEEAGAVEGENKAFTWIIDPINGKGNLMRAIPYFAINIALTNNERAVAGITYDPMRGECFRAEPGSGAYLGNHFRLRTSSREQIAGAVIAVQSDHEIDLQLAKKGATVRRTGSTALDIAYLAAGKYDAVISKGARIWDMVSGEILVREAGGFWDAAQAEDGSYNLVAASSARLLNIVKECL